MSIYKNISSRMQNLNCIRLLLHNVFFCTVINDPDTHFFPVSYRELSNAAVIELWANDCFWVKPQIFRFRVFLFQNITLF